MDKKIDYISLFARLPLLWDFYRRLQTVWDFGLRY